MNGLRASGSPAQVVAGHWSEDFVEGRTLGAVINTLVVTGYAIVAAWRGYERRRAYWSAGSWIGLGLTVLMSCALIGFGLAFSVAVDNHADWVGAARSNTRAAWVVLALSCMVGGSMLGAGSMAWFARGKPSRPFPFFGRVRGGVAATKTGNEASPVVTARE
jgi:hypothetical protein